MTKAIVRVVVAGIAGAAVGLLLEPDVEHAARVALLFLLAAAVAVGAARVVDWLRGTDELHELHVSAGTTGEWRIPQLDAARLQARAALSSADSLHRFFRPVLTEITTARLARTHGIDLQRQAVETQKLVSAELWELVRPDRPAPHDHGRGLTMRRLRALVAEVERT